MRKRLLPLGDVERARLLYCVIVTRAELQPSRFRKLVLADPALHRIQHRLEPYAVEALDTAVDETRDCMRGLRVCDCIVTFRVQQHFVQASEHAVRLQQLVALCFDGLFELSSNGWISA